MNDTPDQPQIGDMVLYVPDCAGDRCDHPPSGYRAAWVAGVYPDGTLALAVLHPVSWAHLHNIPHDPDKGPRTWHHPS